MATSRSLGSNWLTQRSPIHTSPALGSSSPATMRMVVVLPQPLGPSNTRNSPSAMSSDMGSTAVDEPQRLAMFFNWMRAIAVLSSRA